VICESGTTFMERSGLSQLLPHRLWELYLSYFCVTLALKRMSIAFLAFDVGASAEVLRCAKRDRRKP